ncbi:MAG: anti-sigma factor family protein [Solirubrobacteraceae bacterium]
MKRLSLRFVLDHRWTPVHVSPYLDDELSAAQRARLERHIEQCPECRELLRELQRLIVSLGTLSDDTGAPVAASILAAVRSRMDEAPQDAP